MGAAGAKRDQKDRIDGGAERMGGRCSQNDNVAQRHRVPFTFIELNIIWMMKDR